MEQKEIPDKEDFIVFEKTSRHGRWAIQKFPDKGADKFEKAVNLLIPAIFEKLHPTVRNSDVSVLFVEKVLHTGDLGPRFVGEAGAVGVLKTFLSTKRSLFSISISEESLSKIEKEKPGNKYLWALKIVLHELFEMDYWKRSEGIKLKPKLASISDPDYPKYEHEQIADAKAFKHMAEVLNGRYEPREGKHILTLFPPWVGETRKSFS